jgi:hypothetical protein
MRRLVFIVILGVFGWQGYTKYQSYAAPSSSDPSASESNAPVPPRSRADSSPSAFRCDGRTHCSQMASCEEATFFLKNCPGVKMDGDNDGVPCETQWCN